VSRGACVGGGAALAGEPAARRPHRQVISVLCRPPGGRSDQEALRSVPESRRHASRSQSARRDSRRARYPPPCVCVCVCSHCEPVCVLLLWICVCVCSQCGSLCVCVCVCMLSLWIRLCYSPHYVCLCVL